MYSLLYIIINGAFCSREIYMLNKQKMGFTLIELLVVVLIIGILASVALPQYQKAVLKARVTEIKAFLNAAEKGLEIYLMENSSPSEGGIIGELDLDLSAFGTLSGDWLHERSGNWDAVVWGSGEIVLWTKADKMGGEASVIINKANRTYHCGYLNANDKGKEICEAVALGDPRWVIELGS